MLGKNAVSRTAGCRIVIRDRLGREQGLFDTRQGTDIRLRLALAPAIDNSVRAMSCTESGAILPAVTSAAISGFSRMTTSTGSSFSNLVFIPPAPPKVIASCVPVLRVKLSPTSFSAKCMVPALSTFNSSARATAASDNSIAAIEARTAILFIGASPWTF